MHKKMTIQTEVDNEKGTGIVTGRNKEKEIHRYIRMDGVSN